MLCKYKILSKLPNPCFSVFIVCKFVGQDNEGMIQRTKAGAHYFGCYTVTRGCFPSLRSRLSSSSLIPSLRDGGTAKGNQTKYIVSILLCISYWGRGYKRLLFMLSSSSAVRYKLVTLIRALIAIGWVYWEQGMLHLTPEGKEVLRDMEKDFRRWYLSKKVEDGDKYQL